MRLEARWVGVRINFIFLHSDNPVPEGTTGASAHQRRYPIMSTQTTKTTSKRPGKANFDHIYDQRDPRAYYTTLLECDYQIPNHAQHVFGELIQERRERTGQSPRVFDLACSYGINAALLRYDGVTFNDLARRYATSKLQRLTPEQLIELDREYFAARLLPDPAAVYGCDVATNAVHYATRVGLQANGWDVNLETDDPDADLKEVLEQTDIVTVSSAIGYLTYRTMDTVLACIPKERRPWFAAFSLRTAPIDPVAHALRDHGLELATLTGRTVRQRRFVDEREQADAIERIRQRGYVVDGHESDGYWHAQLYVGMPADEEPLRMMGLVED